MPGAIVRLTGAARLCWLRRLSFNAVKHGKPARRLTGAVATYRFAAGHEFDAESGEVRGPLTTAQLEPQPAVLLALLAERAGTLVTYDDIKDRIWGETTHVNFRQSIHYGVRQVRAALGDTTQPPRIIETMPRRGYRLRADVLVAIDPPVPNRLAPAQSTARRRAAFPIRRRVIAAGSLVAAIAVATLVERRPNNHHEIAVRVLKVVHRLVY